MNLNNLKPAWKKYKLLNSMRPMDHEEIHLILERAESSAITKTNRFVIHTFVFIAITLCCQGG